MSKSHKARKGTINKLFVSVFLALLISSQNPAPGLASRPGGYFVAFAGGVVEPAPAPLSPMQAFIYYD